MTLPFHVPPIFLLEVRFQVTAPISNLPHYHGAQWSALFRFLLKPHLPHHTSLSKAGVMVLPIETGVLSYAPGDPLHLGLTVSEGPLPAVFRALAGFNDSSLGEGHFQPGRTVRLEGLGCRISGTTLPFPLPEAGQPPCLPLAREVVEEEIEALSLLDHFTLHFYTPLRLTRPKGSKQSGHRYCDEPYFLGSKTSDPPPLQHLLAKVRERMKERGLPQATVSAAGADDLPPPAGWSVSGGALHWLDLSYGSRDTTFGGAVGRIRVCGKPDSETAALLVLGQYLGVGKNAVFGYGFYDIPELLPKKKVKPLSRGCTLLDRAMAVETLLTAREGLKNSSPGPDGLTLMDLKKAGDLPLITIGQSVLKGEYRQGPVKNYACPKTGGGSREILVQNVIDKMVQRAYADFLLPVVETLLTSSSYAYRKGLNRKGAAAALKKALSQGYDSGLKADISAFFESVDLDQLADILAGLFPFDPLSARLTTWFDAIRELNIKGLPQGSPLSPILSNLYLDRFDRDVKAEGFNLIRYGDDFVALFRSGVSPLEGKNRIEESLARLGLHLKPQKTEEIDASTQIKFLGYLITAAEIQDVEKDPGHEPEQWLPVFRDEWRTGKPVYLSTLGRGAYSSGAYLVIKDTDEQSESIPWSQISRIVVIGRSSFSGGAVYRAVKEGVPATFIDIMGRTTGHLYPDLFETPELAPLQRDAAKDKAFCLEFAREIVAAKIANCHVVLRRNSIDETTLKDLQGKVREAGSIEALRGYEGSAARAYFAGFSRLVEPFEFKGRFYRPPDGPVNAMLSFGYTLLYNRITSVLKHKGFNPRIGFFHQGRGSHNALASDLMENLRHFPERVVLALIHRKEIKPEDFVKTERKVTTWRLNGEGFRKFIRRFEYVMTTRSSYHGGEKMSCNSYLDEMADTLRRSLKLGIPFVTLRID
jgi:CRISPR-associated endonuclease Cas1